MRRLYPEVVFDWKNIARQLAEKREVCRSYRSRWRISNAERRPRDREPFYAVYEPGTRTVYASGFPSNVAMLDAVLHIDRSLKDVPPSLPAPFAPRRAAKMRLVK
jgi:hypothetical protein